VTGAEPPRIDVHRHVWPAEFVAALSARRTPPLLNGDRLVTAEGVFGFERDAYSAERCLADLDANAIDLAVVSLQPTLGVERLQAREAAGLHALWGAGVQDLILRSGGRLSAFSAGWVQDGFAGLCVSADTVRDRPRIDRIATALSERGQALFVHPGPGAPPRAAPAWWAPAVDYTAQMQAAYAAWLDYGAERWPSLPVVFAILAGGAPFQLERFQSRGLENSRVTAGNVYFDTASYGRRSLEFCLATFGITRLVYGSDGPVIDAEPTLSAIHALGKATADAICRVNPSAILAA
jgi:hypothetical protein